MLDQKAVYMDEEEQKWWARELRATRKDIQNLDSRVRGLEQRVMNGISDAIDRLSKVVEKQSDYEESLDERLSKLEEAEVGEDAKAVQRRKIWNNVKWIVATLLLAISAVAGLMAMFH